MASFPGLCQLVAVILILSTADVSSQDSSYVCSQPKKMGPCEAATSRYYYNQDVGRCEHFYWGGCQPNNNNFLSMAECQAMCGNPTPCQQQMGPGPCDAIYGRYYFNINSGTCEVFNSGGCPAPSNDFPTLYECQAKCKPPATPVPGPGPCGMPKIIGPCDAAINRFYFNTNTQRCEPFLYGGCEGNRNNFPSFAQCTSACAAPFPDPCSLPLMSGPCAGAFNRFYFNWNTQKCELFTYGGCQGNSNNFLTFSDCSSTCGSPGPVCEQPKVIGPCKAYVPSYYYNQYTDQCESFIYGGCEGNDNRFPTKAICENTCKDGPVCEQPKVSGPCEAYVPSYYYNQYTKQCESFIYGGCEGNDNRFSTKEMCENTCKDDLPTCQQPKDIGPCRAQVPSYYYNQYTKECEFFYYGGCEGNENRFSTKDNCEKTCKGGDGGGSGSGTGTSVPVVIAIVLAVIIVVMIGVILYCIHVKTGRDHRQRDQNTSVVYHTPDDVPVKRIQGDSVNAGYLFST